MPQSKLIALILMVIPLIIILSFYLHSINSNAKNNIGSIALKQDEFNCKIGKFEIVSCETDSISNLDSECSKKQIKEWEAYKNYLGKKDCEKLKDLKIGPDEKLACTCVQQKIYDLINKNNNGNNKGDNNQNEKVLKIYESYVKENPNGVYTVDSKINQYKSLTQKDLNSFFDKENHPELKIYSKSFIEASKKYNIDPYYLVSHFILETNWGTSKIWKDKNNGFGIHAYDNLAYDSAKSFKTPEIGIEEGAKWISENYLHGTDYRKSTSLNEMNKHYATDKNWKYKIAMNMNELKKLS